MKKSRYLLIDVQKTATFLLTLWHRTWTTRLLTCPTDDETDDRIRNDEYPTDIAEIES